MPNPPIRPGVDRSVPYPAFLVRQSLFDSSNTLIGVLETEVGGSYGAMTGDPAPFPRCPDPGSCLALFGRW